MPLDELQQHLLSMDSEDTRFGALLCERLAYEQLQAGSWEGNEAEGLTRKVGRRRRPAAAASPSHPRTLALPPSLRHHRQPCPRAWAGDSRRQVPA